MKNTDGHFNHFRLNEKLKNALKRQTEREKNWLQLQHWASTCEHIISCSSALTLKTRFVVSNI